MGLWMVANRFPAYRLKVIDLLDLPAFGLGVCAGALFMVFGTLASRLVFGRYADPDADMFRWSFHLKAQLNLRSTDAEIWRENTFSMICFVLVEVGRAAALLTFLFLIRTSLFQDGKRLKVLAHRKALRVKLACRPLVDVPRHRPENRPKTLALCKLADKPPIGDGMFPAQWSDGDAYT